MVRDIQTHGSLYFSDGNIVLTTAGSTGEHVLFWVHQSILAKNSPVFEHMLSSGENHSSPWHSIVNIAGVAGL